MQVRVSHHVDTGDPRSGDLCDLRYEYDLLLFQDDAQALVVRTYTDNPSEAHFLAAGAGAQRRPLTRSDVCSRLAKDALAHLHALGKRQVNWLGEKGYEPVPALDETGPAP